MALVDRAHKKLMKVGLRIYRTRLRSQLARQIFDAGKTGGMSQIDLILKFHESQWPTVLVELTRWAKSPGAQEHVLSDRDQFEEEIFHQAMSEEFGHTAASGAWARLTAPAKELARGDGAVLSIDPSVATTESDMAATDAGLIVFHEDGPFAIEWSQVKSTRLMDTGMIELRLSDPPATTIAVPGDDQWKAALRQVGAMT